MPVHNLCFRASCGQFLTTFLRLHDWTSQLCRQSAKASDHSKKQTWCLVVSVCGQILIVLWRRGNESWAYGRSSGTTPSARRSSRQHTRWTKSSDLQGDAPDGPNEVIFKTTHQMDQMKWSSRRHTRWTKWSDLQGDTPDGPNQVIFKATHQMDQIKWSSRQHTGWTESSDLQDNTPDGPNQVQSDSGTPRKCTADTSVSPDMGTQILEAIRQQNGKLVS